MVDKSGRSREGAWIEMMSALRARDKADVAPARERGLKYKFRLDTFVLNGRSREGAWIEIAWQTNAQQGH